MYSCINQYHYKILIPLNVHLMVEDIKNINSYFNEMPNQKLKAFFKFLNA